MMRIMRPFMVVFTVSLLAGCAQPTRQPLTGFIYSDTKANESVTTNAAAPKTGQACMQSILGVTTGDASMEAAKKAGGITQVAYVDNSSSQAVFGVWAQYCLIVHGR